MTTPRKALWTCPRCGERFTHRGTWHSCGRFDLDALFARCEPNVRATYERLVRAVEAIGPCTVIPQKTRIAFQARMRFLALTPQKRCLKGHFVLDRRTPAPCFEKIETISARNHLHVFRLHAPAEVDAAFRKHIAAAFAVGRQEHLGSGA